MEYCTAESITLSCIMSNTPLARLQTVPTNRLQDLARVLWARLPCSARLYNVLQLNLHGALAPTAEATFYVYGNVQLEEHEEEDPLFCICRQKVHGDHFYTFYESSTHEASLPALLDGNFIDWTVLNQFGATSHVLAKYIAHECTKRGLPTLAFDCKLFAIRPELAAQINVDVGNQAMVTVRRLAVEDVEKIASFWKFSTDKTRAMMRDSIESVGYSYGVYIRTEEEEFLASWILMIQSGNLFSLRTDPNFTGHRYGELVLRAACRFAGQRGLAPATLVETYNKGAMRLMESVGMEQLEDIRWIETTDTV